MKNKGGAKKNKKKTKKKTNYQFYAPRYKDGKMVDGNEFMKEKRLQREKEEENKRKMEKKNKAATNIQKTIRGKKSRNKYDMKSKWYKGFPTNAPEELPDLEITSRIADIAIQGFNTRNSKERLEDKQLEIGNKHTRDLNELGKDKLKYSWGKYYNKYDYNKQLTDDDRKFIGFEKKNYDKLRDIANKRNYWSRQLDKHKPLEYGNKRYDPNSAIDSERFNIRELAAQYYEYPLRVEKSTRRYYDGEYYDEDTDSYKVMPNYKVGELPKLSPVEEQDEDYYEEDDELLLPRDKIIETVDYYKKIKPIEEQILNEYQINQDLLLKEYEELDKKQELDIEKCLHAKKLANADIKLYQDKYFMENYYEPCSDNERLTDIYIDTFYSLPWQLIKPAETTIEDFLDNIPSIYLNSEDEVSGWKNAFITESGVQIFRDILKDQGLLRPWNSSYSRIDYPPFVDFHYLSNFYRWVVPGHTRIRHLPNMPIFRGNKSGKEYLRDTFIRLDQEIEYRDSLGFILNGKIDKSQLNIEKFKRYNIEKFKRYFILNLIGLIGNPKYPSELKQYIDRIKIEISWKKNELKKLIEQEQEAIEYRDSIISKFKIIGEKKNIDKFIKDYKLGLLQGLDELDDSIMHTAIATLESVEPEIKSLEKKLEKMEKDLNTAIRFSKITFTEKDYSTFEYEKLIYK
jgi:hypothetical protein